MMSKMEDVLRRYERWIPFVLMGLFIALALPGLRYAWNPDELLHRVNDALAGEWSFDTENFDYPSLPKYVMFALGKAVYALGGSEETFNWGARFLSVLLGAATIWLVYALTRKLRGSVAAATVAGLLVAFSSEMSHNARFAHNDLYLVFFSVLTVFFSARFLEEEGKGWLYASFFAAGLATSSKYNGLPFLALPALVYLLFAEEVRQRKWISLFETLSLGGVLFFLGYAVGTPKALLWMSYYFKRMTPAFLRHARFGRTPSSQIGAWGQWRVARETFSAAVFFWYGLAFLWFAAESLLLALGKLERGAARVRAVTVLVLAVLLFDLPIMISYNYQSRFFLPFIPLLSVLAALFLEDLLYLSERYRRQDLQRWILAAVFIVLGYAGLRSVSVALLFKNDARIPASAFLETLPAGTSVEYTYYPPRIPEGHFERSFTYPLIFKKFMDEDIGDPPPGKPYKKYNQGEEGLLARGTDYLIVDNFTYDRFFTTPYYCETNPVECNFFKRLLAGESSYRLIADFRYDLPKFLPQIEISFVNPEIRIYERTR
jgi:4-amino-4-deoxy-L-arabinose transferase-like glycosyltransferase